MEKVREIGARITIYTLDTKYALFVQCLRKQV